MREIKLNIQNRSCPAVLLNVSQFDKGYEVTATVYNGITLFTPPTGATATVEGRKPDNTGYQYPATIDGSTVTFTMAEQMTVLSGRSMAEIVFYDADSVRIGTANFYIIVEAAPLNESTVISDTDLPAIIDAANANAERAEEAADEAEATLANFAAVVAEQVEQMQIHEGQTVIDGTLTVSGAAADAKATGDKFTESVKVLPSVIPTTEAFDLNTETESGNRLLRGGAAGFLNAPTGFVSGGLVTFAMKDKYILQILRDNKGVLWYRSRNVFSVWADWVEVAQKHANDIYNFACSHGLISVNYQKSGQGMCAAGDYLVSCDGNGGMYAYNITNASYNALTGASVGHGNSITYDPVNNKYYVSGWDDGNVYVVSIDFTNLTYTIDRTIDVSACGLRTTVGYIPMTQQLFVVACQSTKTIGTPYKLCLTDLNGNITKEVSLPYSFNAVQDIHVHGLNAYVSHGMNSTYPSSIYVFSTQTLELVDVYEFSTVIKNSEIEGLTKYDGELLVAFVPHMFKAV